MGQGSVLYIDYGGSMTHQIRWQGGFESLLSDQGFREKERDYSYRLQRTFHEFISGYIVELGIKPRMQL